MRIRLPLSLVRQPDGTSCGPTALMALAASRGDVRPLDHWLTRVPREPNGGTFAATLAWVALQMGHSPILTTCNLEVFDPTWFPDTGKRLCRRLEQRLKRLPPGRCRANGRAFLRYVKAGGRLQWKAPSDEDFIRALNRGQVILTGLSQTWLHQESREWDHDGRPDAIHGSPVGHFVLIHGHDPAKNTFLVADPLGGPGTRDRHRWITATRLISSIFLGLSTHDTDSIRLDEPRTRIVRK